MEEHIKKDYRYRMQIAIGVACICFLGFFTSIYAGSMSNKENAELHIENANLNKQLSDQQKQYDTLNKNMTDLVNEVQELIIAIEEVKGN